MKKAVFIFVLLSFSFFTSFAQTPKLWEPLPLEFNNLPSNYSPGNMYYDSVDDVSYIGGGFFMVNDTMCNFIKYDGQSFTLLPPAPLSGTGPIIRYKDKIYVGYSDGLATWDGLQWAVIDSTAG